MREELLKVRIGKGLNEVKAENGEEEEVDQELLLPVVAGTGIGVMREVAEVITIKTGEGFLIEVTQDQEEV